MTGTIDPTAVISPSAKVSGTAIIEAGAILGSYCQIDENVRIGIGAIISDHVFIGRGSVIRPGSVVTMNVPGGVVVSGNPAKCTGKATGNNEDGHQARYAIPQDANWNYCKAESCRRMIYWILTPAGKRMPVDTDGTPHFVTCPAAGRFRNKRKLHS